MAKCVNIPRQSRRYCIGDLRETIQVQTRALTPPALDGVDHQEVFSSFLTVHAFVKTTKGTQIFDGTDTLIGIQTHEFIVRYRPGVTFEKWILWRGRRFRLIDSQNLDENNQFYILRASERGTEANLANES